MVYGHSLKRAGSRVRARLSRSKKASSSRWLELSLPERALMLYIRDDTIGIGSDYVKVGHGRDFLLKSLKAKGLVQTGDHDDATTNVWLTSKGKDEVMPPRIARGWRLVEAFPDTEAGRSSATKYSVRLNGDGGHTTVERITIGGAGLPEKPVFAVVSSAR